MILSDLGHLTFVKNKKSPKILYWKKGGET